MSEWKELDIANLPPDILTGDYEFDFPDLRSFSERVKAELDILKGGKIRGLRYRCTRALPSHEEIMTKWWQDDNKSKEWIRIVGYIPNYSHPYKICEQRYVSKEWFIDHKSSDIPPEAIND